MIQGHGGNIYDLARRSGCRPEDIIDVSSNINPLGPPPGLMAHLKENMNAVCVLPEVDSKTVSTQMAEALGVDEACILAGAGTTQFIYSLFPALASQKVLIVGPTYSDYADACRMHCLTPDYFFTRAEDDFQPDMDRLHRQVKDYDTVIICNPNNPTGVLISGSHLTELCRRHPQTRFVIDESYLAFVPTADIETMIGCGLDNVLVLHSLSKIYRLPGLRIGFLVASTKTIARFEPLMTPWRLNSLAQSAVQYICGHSADIQGFVRETRDFIQKEREQFVSAARANPNLKVYPSHTSYHLMQLSHGLTAEDAAAQFAAERILIRNCANFSGLDRRFIRIALHRQPVNQRIANIIEHLRRNG